MSRGALFAARTVAAAIIVSTLTVWTAPARAQQCGDVDNSGAVVTSDALLVLKAATGQDVDLVCDGGCAVLEERLAALEALLGNVTLEGDRLVITGVNVQIVDGSGDTDGPVNGVGNLIVGYDEDSAQVEKTGSHNLILGRRNQYTSYSGIVSGEDNSLTQPGSAVLSGTFNQANGEFSAVVGGFDNEARGETSGLVRGEALLLQLVVLDQLVGANIVDGLLVCNVLAHLIEVLLDA